MIDWAKYGLREPGGCDDYGDCISYRWTDAFCRKVSLTFYTKGGCRVECYPVAGMNYGNNAIESAAAHLRRLGCGLEGGK